MKIYDLTTASNLDRAMLIPVSLLKQDMKISLGQLMKMVEDGIVLPPSLKAQYSADGTVWHAGLKSSDEWMRLSDDGGATWSDPMPLRGKDGQEGLRNYTWIKFADDEHGSGMSDSPAGKSWLGIAYNKDTAEESDDPADYTWMSVKGDPGRSVTSVVSHYATGNNPMLPPPLAVFVDVPPGKVPVMTATDPVLWRYDTTYFSDGTEEDTVPAVAGVHGDKGESPTIKWDGTKLKINDFDAVDLRGLSAYEVYRKADPSSMLTESEWVASLKGDKFKFSDFTADELESLRGPQGVIGPRGPQGIIGPQGNIGPKGEDGETPEIDPITKRWVIGGKPTGIIAEGKDGHSPVVAINSAHHLTVDGVAVGDSLKGADGAAAVVYSIVPSADKITKSYTGTITPSKVSCSVYKTTGSSTREATADMILKYQFEGVSASTDGYAETVIAHPAGITAEKTVPSEATAIVFTLYDGATMLCRNRIVIVPAYSDLQALKADSDTIKKDYVKATELDSKIDTQIVSKNLISKVEVQNAYVAKGDAYTLPTASATVKGGVKIGVFGGLKMEGETLLVNLEASHIPSLDWSKITSGKPTTLAGYGIGDAYTKSEVYSSPIVVYIQRFIELDFDDDLPMTSASTQTPHVYYDTISKTLVAAPGVLIRPVVTSPSGVYPNWIGAPGMGSVLSSQSPRRGWVPRSDVLYYSNGFYRWNGTDMEAVDALNDTGGLDEAQLASYLTTNNYAKKSDIPSLSGYATEGWVQSQGFLKSHQPINTLVILKNGSVVGSYKPNEEGKTIDITDVASAATLSSHIGNTTMHIAAAERTLWNQTATKLNAILGTDSDNIINKWEEVVAFLDTYTEADTLANLLSNKANKATTLAGYGITDAYTKTEADGRFQPKGSYLTAHQNIYPLAVEAGGLGLKFVYNPKTGGATLRVPTHTSHLTNDSGFLTSHQSLANYVTKNTAQDITGVKTYLNGLMPVAKGLPYGAYGDGLAGTRIYQDGIAIRPSASGSDGGWLRMIETTANQGSLELAIGDDGNEPIYVRGYNTGGSATRSITLLDASGNQDFNTVTATAFRKKGGTSAQFLMADGSVATKHMLSSVTNLGWGGTSGQVATINTLAFWNGQYAGGASNLQYCDRGRFGTMATKNAADYPTMDSFNAGVAFMAGKFPDQGAVFNVMHDEGALGIGITVNIPTKTSHLTNDSGFVTGSGADAKYVTALGIAGDWLTWTKNGAVNNLTVHFATESKVLRSHGRLTAVTNTKHGAGLRMYEVYNNGYPTLYGNLIAVQGGTSNGQGELLLGWSGSNSGHASIYYRNQRDNDSAFSAWATILDSVNYGSVLGNVYASISRVSTLESTVSGHTSQIGGLQGSVAAKVSKAGDTMTGALNVPRVNVGNMYWDSTGIMPLIAGNNLYTCGKADGRWANVYTTTINVTSTALVSNLNADLLDGLQGTSYAYGGRIGFLVGSARANITTAQFISKLSALGAFNRPQWSVKCTWSYANNDIITDTGLGNIQLAGAVIEVHSNSANEYTVRITTSPTTDGASGVTNAVFIYRNHGSGYAPNWKRLANTSDNVASATKLHDNAAFSAWGQTFFINGKPQSVAGNMSNVGNINPAARNTINIGSNGGEFAQVWSRTFRSNIADHLWVINDNSAYGINLRIGTTDALTVASNLNVGIGTTAPTQKLDVRGSIIADSWVRTRGNAGWYSETHGGGWCMSDSTWIRIHGGKSLYAVLGIIRTDGEFQVGAAGDKFRVTAAGAVSSASSVTAASFVKRGGNASQLLAANGSVRGVLTYDDLSDKAIDIRNISITEADPVVTREALSGWDGSYKINLLVNGAATETRKSDLAYCNKGAFGDMATKSAADYVTVATAQNISGAKRFSSGILSVRNTNACGLVFYSFSDSDTDRVAAIELLGASGSWLRNSLDFYKSGRIVARNTLTAASFIKSGGTASQVLMADGSVRETLTSTVGTMSGLAIPASSPQNSIVEQWWLMNWDGRFMLTGNDTAYCNLRYCDRGRFGDIVTHSASEFLTAHQSLANYVTLNSAQTISGKKTFTADTLAARVALRGQVYMYSSAYNSSYRTIIMAVGNGNESDSTQKTYGILSLWTIGKSTNDLGGSNTEASVALMGFDKNKNMIVGAYGGSVTAQAKLHVAGGIYASGNISGSTITNRSDARLKTRVDDIALTVADIAAAPLWRYRWKDTGAVDVGSTAQYWGTILPELTHTDQQGWMSLDYGKTALLASVSLARTADDHETRIAALEAENALLKDEIARLRAA